MNIRAVLDELESVVPPKDAALSFFFHMADCAYNAHFGNLSQYQVQTGNDIVYEPPTPQHMQFLKRILVIFADFETICTILHRARWTVKQHPGQFSADECISYLQADVHAFHAEVRSLFDSVALTTKDFFSPEVRPRGVGKLPDTFFDLRGWCFKHRHRGLLDTELAKLISYCDWFDEFRDFRDSIVHKEKDAFVRRLDKDQIIFSTSFGGLHRPIYKGPTQFLLNDWILFSPYAGYYVGRLLSFLDDYCKFSSERLNIDVYGSSMLVPTRVAAAHDCIRECLNLLRDDSLSSRETFDRNWDRIRWE